MQENNYYNSLDDIPFYNWKQCMSGNLKFVRIDLSKGNKEDDEKYWELLYDSYLLEFGLGTDFEIYYDLKIELAHLHCDFVIKDDNFILNRINVLNKKIDDILNKGEKNGQDKIIIYLSKWVGSMINEKETSVRTIYTMSEEYNKEMNELKKRNNG